MTRVLLWTELFWPYIGGVETFATRLAPALQQRGFEMLALSSHGSLSLPDRGDYAGIPIYRFPFQRALRDGGIDEITRLLKAVASLKRDFRPHLIHLNPTDPSFFFHLHTAPSQPAKTLATIHSEFRDCAGGRRTLLGRLLRSTDWITAVSDVLLEHVRRLSPDVRSRSSVIYYGLAPSVPPPVALSTRPLQLVALGRLVWDKGFDVAIRALARLRRAHPEARLVIGGDGPERSALAELARAVGQGEAVEFRGWLDAGGVSDLLDSASLVLVPSRRSEGFGLVALEAGARGRPVVASREGGLVEAVVHGETGLLVEADDPRQLADASADLLADLDRLARFGRAGRARALEVFGFDRHVREYEALYRRLVDPLPTPSTAPAGGDRGA